MEKGLFLTDMLTARVTFILTVEDPDPAELVVPELPTLPTSEPVSIMLFAWEFAPPPCCWDKCNCIAEDGGGGWLIVVFAHG